MSGTVAVQTTCYRPLTNGTISPIDGTFYLNKGSGSDSYCCFDSAEYLADGICYQSSHTGNSTGYYVALCSDPTYKDPSCSQSCGTPYQTPRDTILVLTLTVKYSKGDIVYSNNQWYCCGTDSDGNPACNSPTTETIPNLPSPNQLQADATATSTATSTSTSTSSSSATSTSPAGSIPSPSFVSDSVSSSGLSTGAKAGIGVGAGVAALAAIILFTFFYMRRSRRAHQQRDHLLEKTEPAHGITSGYSQHSAVPPAYADTGYRPQPKPQQPSELASPPIQHAPVEMGESAARNQGHAAELG